MILYAPRFKERDECFQDRRRFSLFSFERLARGVNEKSNASATNVEVGKKASN